MGYNNKIIIKYYNNLMGEVSIDYQLIPTHSAWTVENL